jgi:hypothetical protein
MCLLLAAFVMSAVASGGHAKVRAHAASRCKTYRISGRHIHLCNGLNGAGGPQGPAGPAGPSGPAGATGAAGTGVPFEFVLPETATTQTYYDGDGIKISAACSGGALSLELEIVSGDHNLIEGAAFDTRSGSTFPLEVLTAEGHQPYALQGGGSKFDAYTGLLNVRTGVGQMLTIQWWASAGYKVPSQGTCVGGGTVSPH